MRPLLLALPLLVASGCAPRALAPSAPSVAATTAGRPAAAPLPVDSAAVRAAVLEVLDAQVAAWNAGNIRGFMEGYERDRDLAFLSGDDVRLGWQTTLYGYLRAYPDAASMGRLTFSELHVRPLTNDDALVWGRWGLSRETAADTDPGGLFTLLFRRNEQHGWRIIHDHTSSR